MVELWVTALLHGNQSNTPCDPNLRTAAGNIPVDTAYLGGNHIFQPRQRAAYPGRPSVLPRQMSRSLHHLGGPDAFRGRAVCVRVNTAAH